MEANYVIIDQTPCCVVTQLQHTSQEWDRTILLKLCNIKKINQNVYHPSKIVISQKSWSLFRNQSWISSYIYFFILFTRTLETRFCHAVLGVFLSLILNNWIMFEVNVHICFKNGSMVSLEIWEIGINQSQLATLSFNPYCLKSKKCCNEYLFPKLCKL